MCVFKGTEPCLHILIFFLQNWFHNLAIVIMDSTYRYCLARCILHIPNYVHGDNAPSQFSLLIFPLNVVVWVWKPDVLPWSQPGTALPRYTDLGEVTYPLCGLDFSSATGEYWY